MTKRYLRIFILLLVVSLLSYTARDDLFFKNESVRAFGDLTVDSGVSSVTPIFNSQSMSLGESETKIVTITNSATKPRLISLRGIRTNDMGIDTEFEAVLDIVIEDEAGPLYGRGSQTGSKTVQDFFIDSKDPNGIQLNTINPDENKIYAISVSLPENAGSKFHAKAVIFDVALSNEF